MKHLRLIGLKKNGMALAFVLVSVLILTLIGFALGSRGIQSIDTSFRIREDAQAFYAAQAGVARSLYAIEQSDPALPACGSTGSPVFSGGNVLNDNGSFSVLITNNSGGCSSSNLAAPDGTSVPPGDAYIFSSGAMGPAKKISTLMAQISSGWPFDYAAFGRNGVTLNGNAFSDSYDSGNGDYCAQCAAMCSGPPLQPNDSLNWPAACGTKGNVGTNNSANSSITLSGNAGVSGSANVGPGGTAGSPTISVSGNGGYDAASVLSSPLPFPPVTDPLGGDGTTNVSVNGSQTLPPGRYGNITVSGNGSLTLTCGSYSVAGITVSGNGQLIVSNSCTKSAPVKLYVYNTLQITGNGITNQGDISPRFLIYGMSTLTSAKVSGNGQSAFALYAPNANITVSGNGDIFGSVVGNSATASGGGHFHYDQALNNDPYAGTGVMVTPLSWTSR